MGVYVKSDCGILIYFYKKVGKGLCYSFYRHEEGTKKDCHEGDSLWKIDDFILTRL
jgi:hypothetical protein